MFGRGSRPDDETNTMATLRQEVTNARDDLVARPALAAGRLTELELAVAGRLPALTPLLFDKAVERTVVADPTVLGVLTPLGGPAAGVFTDRAGRAFGMAAGR